MNSENVSFKGHAIRIIIPVLGFMGIGISGYLTYVHYRWLEPVCFAGLDCNSILFSPYAVIWGVPISLIGMVMYTLLTISGLLILLKKNWASSVSAMAVYTLALSGTLYSFFLIYREFRMHAFCSWCLASALVVISLLALSLLNLSDFGISVARIPGLLISRLFTNGRFTGPEDEI
jgi:uncharacterized membrane protein